MLHRSTAILNELSTMIDDEVTRLTENLVLGMSIPDFAEYRRLTGQIQGLKKALELIDEAASKVDHQ